MGVTNRLLGSARQQARHRAWTNAGAGSAPAQEKAVLALSYSLPCPALMEVTDRLLGPARQQARHWAWTNAGAGSALTQEKGRLGPLLLSPMLGPPSDAPPAPMGVAGHLLGPVRQ